MHHMTPDEFRRAGAEFLEWAARWMERAPGVGGPGAPPVLSRAAPGDIAAMLPAHAPEQGEGSKDWLADLDRVVAPGITEWQSPRFFGFFPCNTTGPAILGDLIGSTINAQGMMWLTSPAYTEIETRMLDWLRELLGLPARFDSRGAGGGVLQGTASEAALVCLAAARDRAMAAHGAPLERLVAYTSAQSHSSIAKGARVAGLRPDRVRLVGVDSALRMRPDLLERAVAQDRAQGLLPCFLCATIGTTSSGAFDPVRPIGDVARRAGAWLHVDAAWAGAACVCPEFRAMFEGVDLADSLSFNPHKWLLTTFDCSALWVADRRAVIDAMSITPEYLRNQASDSGAVLDYRDWGVPLGRRFRALKLWFVLRWYGAQGLREHIRLGVKLGELLESLVREDVRFELAAPRSLGLVCLRVRDADPHRSDARTRTLIERVNASGRAFFSRTTLPAPPPDGPPVSAIRVAIGGLHTREEHVREAWALLRQTLDEVR